MKKTIDKIITGFFVVILGALWYFSTKQYVKPAKYHIIIQDNMGKIVNLKEIRTDFETQEVAYSYIKEYETMFQDHSFSIEMTLPEFRYIIFNKVLNNNSQR